MLKEAFRRQFMQLKFEEVSGRKTLKPALYLAIEFDYKSRPVPNAEKVRRENESWLVQLTNEIWEGLPSQSRFISGAVGASILTGKDYSDTNTDVAFLHQKEVLSAHVKAAEKHNFYLMERVSGKLSKNSPFKLHFFHPTSIEKLGRNLELTRIDPEAGIICQEFNQRNHIKIYLHNQKDNSLVCTEDKPPIYYPLEYFRGVQTIISDTPVYVIDPRYTYLKLNDIMMRKEKNYQKHESKLRRIKDFLWKNRTQFPMTELN